MKSSTTFMKILTVRYWMLLVFLVSVTGCVSVKTADTQNYKASYPQARKIPPAVNGSIFDADSSRPLFEDIKARYVGDILTIALVEKTDAKKKANTKSSKENTLETGATTLFGRIMGTDTNHNPLAIGIDSTNELTAKGTSDQSNSLSGTITVTVAEVLSNGNLYVRGQKRTRINQGDEFIQISGIVRPVDIGPDNTIPSTLVADARITYSGEGQFADYNTTGWLSRFFNSPLWPL